MASGLEEAIVGEDSDLANSMGLFLQKTNIIRDFLEDWQDGRSWWPKDVWANYTDSLDSFTLKANLPAAVKCLNHLVRTPFPMLVFVFETATNGKLHRNLIRYHVSLLDQRCA